MPPDPQDFPMLFSQYRWDSYHAAFGWPPDCLQDGFPWIVSLENRFKGVLEQGGVPDVSFLALLHEYQDALHLAGLSRPGYGLRAASHDWTAAEIEMALFSWASRQEG